MKLSVRERAEKYFNRLGICPEHSDIMCWIAGWRSAMRENKKKEGMKNEGF